jgi:hypothetical protein
MNGTEEKNGTHKPEILSRPRARRDAAGVLANVWQQRLRRMYEAQASGDEDEIVMAVANMSQVMYENIEFAIWALKTVAGQNPPPPEALRPITKHAPPPANDARFVKPPPVILNCTCPPLEAGIIGRDRHMTSCPLFQP